MPRPNPKQEWEIVEVPELRIVDDGLWGRVKHRQNAARKEMGRDDSGNPLNRAHRKKYMFSGLIRCGTCGGGYTIMGKDRYGCATHRSKGTCSNTRRIKRQTLEDRILSGLNEQLMEPELLSAFIREYEAEVERISEERDEASKALKLELERTRKKIQAMIAAIEDGLYSSSMKEHLTALEAKKVSLESELTSCPAPAAQLSPDLVKVYTERVNELTDCLNSADAKTEAIEIIRDLVDKVVLYPEVSCTGLKLELYGNICGILELCEDAGLERDKPAANSAGCQLSVVAGAGNHLYRTRFLWPCSNGNCQLS